MRNLVVCCDGTWNTPEQRENGVPTPTNVVRLYNALDGKGSGGEKQIKYYHPGVGTEGHWWEKAAGGMAGAGLRKNVMSAYKWLAARYQPGDRVFLFGFSRGAYTVRCVAGMISACGLLDLTGLSDDDIWSRVESAYGKGYRKGPATPEDRSRWAKTAKGDWAFHKAERGDGGADVGVHFLGVWDTVGALGIPDDMALLNLLDNRKEFEFRSTELSDAVTHARHAVSIDEMRASFTPTLWSNAAKHGDAKEVWFPGVHSDVGGGYIEKGLSDGALRWMIDEATQAGLAFDAAMSGQIAPNAIDVLHDSRTGVFSFLRTQPRAMPLVAPIASGSVHQSARDRQVHPPIVEGRYRPTTLWRPTAVAKPGASLNPVVLLDLNQSVEISIFALNPWNDTGIYLEAGAEYRFEASGQWVDRTVTCGPEGTRDGKFQIGEVAHVAASLWGKAENLFKKVTGNQEADFRFTKRHEEWPWFSLIGVVANGGNPKPDGTPAPHETFLIAKGLDGFSPTRSGYLYCFANDAWHFYDNNRGSVTLKVTRTA